MAAALMSSVVGESKVKIGNFLGVLLTGNDPLATRGVSQPSIGII